MQPEYNADTPLLPQTDGRLSLVSAAAPPTNQFALAPAHPHGPSFPRISEPMTITARDIMITDVLTVPANLPLKEVAGRLAQFHISGAPVVDDDGCVVGVISEKDLLEQAQSHASVGRLTLLRFGFEALPPDLLQQAYQDGLSLRARDVMSHPIVFAGEDTPVEALADLMLSHRVNRLPILRSGRAVGIVTREDVLRAIVSLLHADDGTSSSNDEESDENDQEEPR